MFLGHFVIIDASDPLRLCQYQYLAKIPPYFFHSFALQVCFGYPGFLSAGMFRTIFKIDRTASQTISRN